MIKYFFRFFFKKNLILQKIIIVNLIKTNTMKKLITTLFLSAILFTGCSTDEAVVEARNPSAVVNLKTLSQVQGWWYLKSITKINTTTNLMTTCQLNAMDQQYWAFFPNGNANISLETYSIYDMPTSQCTNRQNWFYGTEVEEGKLYLNIKSGTQIYHARLFYATITNDGKTLYLEQYASAGSGNSSGYQNILKFERT